MAKIIFVSGAHGVGKTTFCRQIKHQLALPHYSSSSLIKAHGQFDELSKLSTNADDKQLILLDALDKIAAPTVILDGHFCLLNSKGLVIEIKDSIYHRMKPSVIIVVTCPPDVVHQRLLYRDKNSFPVDLIEEMQTKEMRKASRIAHQLNIPLLEYKSASDIEALVKNVVSLKI